MGRGQGQTVSPLAPAAHGVPAGLELQAYPGEKGTKRGLRGSTSISITGWQDSCWLASRPMVSKELSSSLAGAPLGRDSPSCLPGRCPQGGQCLREIPEWKQRVEVTQGDYEGKCQGHRSYRGTDLDFHLILQGM